MTSSDYFDSFFFDIERLKLNEGDIIVRFFFVLSRFEFALKMTGYLMVGDRAEPDWKRFSNSVKDKYSRGEHEDVDSAVTYLCEKPVGRQVRSNRVLSFEPMSRNGQPDIEFAIQSIRMIRNNLFHGGKFPSGPVTDPARDKELLSSGLVVLAQCLEWNGKLRKTFFEIEK